MAWQTPMIKQTLQQGKITVNTHMGRVDISIDENNVMSVAIYTNRKITQLPSSERNSQEFKIEHYPINASEKERENE